MAREPQPGEQEFLDLLQELRVVLPGVQLLLAFQLAVPFAARFEDLVPVDLALYGVGVIAAVLAVVFLIAPTAQHRIAWSRGTPDYAQLLPLGSREALLGMAGVAISTVASAFVVIDFVYHQPLAAAAVAAVAVAIVWLWLLVHSVCRHTAVADSAQAGRAAAASRSPGGARRGADR